MKVSKLEVCNACLLFMASGLNICAFVENDKPLTAITAVCFGIAGALTVSDIINPEENSQNCEERQNNKSARIKKRLTK